MSNRYYSHVSERSSFSDYSSGKTTLYAHSERVYDDDVNDAKNRETIRSTLRLKVNLLLVSLFSLALVGVAALQSYKHFITLGYAPLVPDNSRTAVINAVVAVYGAITGMATRMAVTQCLNLISIKALITGGKFVWSAKTWAYMSHANGPWYTLGPLFIAGLAATAVISILPAAVVDPNHFVYVQVAPDTTVKALTCVSGNYISPTIWCAGASLAAMLLQTYSIAGDGYARQPSPQLMLNGQLSSNRSLGYPWNLINNNIAQYTKYNISHFHGSYRQTNKTACIWVLDQAPLRCSFLNHTNAGPNLYVQSPYTDFNYTFNNMSSGTQEVPQSVYLEYFDSGQTEMAVIGWFDNTITYYQGVYTAFVCITRDISEVHVGRYVTSESNGANTYIDLANDTNCLPNYALPGIGDLRDMMNDMAGGIYQFASVDGWNTLIESFSQSFFDIGNPMFGDSQSMLEDGMGSFMALMLSRFYQTSSDPVSPTAVNATRINGGYMVTTVGLGESSLLYIWLAVAILPLFTLSVALCMTVDYIPAWDVMNPMDALATEAVMDEQIAARKGRSSGIRLGMFNGRVVASNTNLPTRISKEDTLRSRCE